MINGLNIDSEFQSLIPVLSEEEYRQLEQNLTAEGCRDALVCWNDGEHLLLIDGHNRFEICNRLALPYQVVERQFECREDVIAWIVDNQLGRRNLNAFVRGELALKKKTALAAKAKANQLTGLKQGDERPVLENSPKRDSVNTLELFRGCRVWDVRFETAYQQLEVDFIVERHSDQSQVNIEVKHDEHIGHTLNFPFEEYRHYHQRGIRRDGWSVFTESDQIYLWYPKANCFYIFLTAWVKFAYHFYIRQNPSVERRKVFSDHTCDTYLVLIPLQYMPYYIYRETENGWEYRYVKNTTQYGEA